MTSHKEKSTETFQPLRDRWSSTAFPALHEDTFPDHLLSIIEDQREEDLVKCLEYPGLAVI